MKKLLSVLLGLGLMAVLSVPSQASWNVRQKGNGSTVWTDGRVEVPVGTSGIVLPITNFAQSATYFVVTNKPGRVRRIYAVNNQSFPTGSASPTVFLSYSTGATAAFTPISAGGTLTMTTAAFAGRMSSLEIPDYAPLNALSQSNVLGVSIIGTSVSAGVNGTITIVVE